MAGHSDDTTQALIEPTRCVIEPNNCPLEAPLHVELEFDALCDLPSVFWEITFIADQTNKRQHVKLGQTEVQVMQAGPNAMTFSIDAVDVSALKKHVLTNVGLLALDLWDTARPEDPLVRVGMVTNVLEDPSGQLIRDIFDPLG